MNYINKAILNKYKEHWHTLRDAGFIKNLTKDKVEEIEKCYQSLIDPNFYVNKWCMSCVAEMIRILYVATKFDEEHDDAIGKSEMQQFMEVIEMEEAKQEIESVFEEKSVDVVDEPKPQPKKRKYKKRK